MKKKTKIKNGCNGASQDRPLTEGRMIHIIEDLRDHIKSTARGTEAILRKEIQKVCERVDRTEVALTEHTRLIKGIDTKIDRVRTELKEEIQGIRAELKEDMRQMEGRLSEKIGGHSARLDNHEIRISAIEQG